MSKSVPLWIFLLFILLAGLFSVMFAWSVKSTVANDEHSARLGKPGRIAVSVASFPDQVKLALKNLAAESDAGLRVPRSRASMEGFRPVRTGPGIDVRGLMVKADEDALARASGWRLLVGPFTIDGKLNHAAIALSPTLEVVNTWVIEEEGTKGESVPAIGRKLIRGFALLRDASMIFTFDGGKAMHRVDRCGKSVWWTNGRFHHEINVSDDQKNVWALSYDSADLDEILQLDVATGSVVRRIAMADIIAANPTIDILEIRQHNDALPSENPRATVPRWQRDPIHLNDVEPLPERLADRFQAFAPGDLLLSSRVLNLVFVMDPTTLRVKWWKSGAWRRQHDPDWQPTGEISIYDNRTDRGYSRIVSENPSSDATTIVLDGNSDDWYSRIQGNHQITPAGNILITSPQQGRVFEVDSKGDLVLEIFNNKPGTEDISYFVSDAIWFPAAEYNFERNHRCEN